MELEWRQTCLPYMTNYWVGRVDWENIVYGAPLFAISKSHKQYRVRYNSEKERLCKVGSC